MIHPVFSSSERLIDRIGFPSPVALTIAGGIFQAKAQYFTPDPIFIPSEARVLGLWRGR